MTHSVVDPSTFFESTEVQCARCGQRNDFGPSERLYFADGSHRCIHCGFLFIQHLLRKMGKMREMVETDPEWRALLRAGRVAEVTRRLDALVPIEPDAVLSPTPRRS
jgi:hypothetical protein